MMHSISPTPADEKEVAAILAAISLFLTTTEGQAVAGQDYQGSRQDSYQETAWRFSGRWWNAGTKRNTHQAGIAPTWAR